MTSNHAIEEIKQNLLHESKLIRKKYLDKLIQDEMANMLDINEEDKLQIFKICLSIFKDRSEACRERAIHFVIMYVKFRDLPVDLMSQLLSVIHKHLLVDKDSEASEEVFLQYIKLLNIIVCKHKDHVGSHLQEIVSIVIAGVCHQYPEVIKGSCECTSNLMEKVPEIHSYSDNLINVILKVLKHKHARVRVTAINSLKNIIHFGRPSAIEFISGPLGECLLDQNPLVRTSISRTVSFWISHLPGRYSYFHFLLPLILTLLEDTNEEIRNEADCMWHQIGVKYLQENMETLKDKDEFLPESLEHYPASIKRPNLGCRTLVQNEMMKIIPTLTQELNDWRIEVRIKSSELLKSIIRHVEARIVSSLDVLIPAMCKACQDEEILVKKNVIEATEFLGYFVTPNFYWSLVITQMKEKTPRVGQYVLLASLLKHSKGPSLQQHLNEIISSISISDVRETRDELSQRNLLTIISKLLNFCSECKLEEALVINLYVVLLTLMALGNEDIQIQSKTQIQRLSEVCSNSKAAILNELYLSHIFKRLDETRETWESYSSDFKIFLILLLEYANDVFEFVPNALLGLLSFVLDFRRDNEIVFTTLTHLVRLYQYKKFNVGKYEVLAENIILGPVKSQLIWKAGRVLEIVRCTASSVVLLHLQSAPTVSSEFITQIFPLLQGLCGDSNEETRKFSLQCLPYINKYTQKKDIDIFSKVFEVASDRLNDKCNSVRVTTLKVLKEILLEAPDFHVYKNNSNFQIILEGLKLIFLTADDDDNGIREVVLDVFSNQCITQNIKSIIGENEIRILLNKYRHVDTSHLLFKYLKI